MFYRRRATISAAITAGQILDGIHESLPAQQFLKFQVSFNRILFLPFTFPEHFHIQIMEIIPIYILNTIPDLVPFIHRLVLEL